MRRKIASLISVALSYVKFSFMKILHGSSFKFELIERFSPRTVVEIDNGKLSLGNKVRAHTGTVIKVRPKGEMIIGDDVSFNYNCIVVCMEKIIIHNGVEFGPGVKIYDHDHNNKVDGGLRANEFICEPIEIGENSWIGADTIILKGSSIGKNCVIGAGSIIKGKIEDNTTVVQKRTNHYIN